MDDASLMVRADAVEVSAEQRDGMFYVVSKRKFAILYTATMGVYALYWFYKNWERYKECCAFDSPAGKIWPAARATFSVFFVNSLFRHVKEHAPDNPEVRNWGNGNHAALLVFLLLVEQALDRAAMRSIGSPYTDWLGMIILAPLLLCFSVAQDMINVSCGDPSGAQNAKLTMANYAWIALGCVMWALTFIGMMLPD